MAYEKFRSTLIKEYNGCCAACGCSLAGLCIDHATSRKDGGKDEIDNLQILCYICNSEIKGDTSMPKMQPRKKCNSERRVEIARRAFRKTINQIRKAA